MHRPPHLIVRRRRHDCTLVRNSRVHAHDLHRVRRTQEVGGHLGDRLWQEFWDAVFVFSNVLLAVLFGAALGNVARGVPLTADGTFYLPFFTNFGIHGMSICWIGTPSRWRCFCVLILTAHGATYLTMKTEGSVHERSLKLVRRLWLAVIPAFLFITLLTWTVRPELFQGILFRPFAWTTLVICVASAYAIATGIRNQREHLTLLGSTFCSSGC
jgi:cytochrome bd ubiquinol oxidase subunit II